MEKAIILSLFLLAGCASVNITDTYTDKDGRPHTCTASYNSLFHNIDGVNMSACGGSGGAARTTTDAAWAKILMDTAGKLLMP